MKITIWRINVAICLLAVICVFDITPTWGSESEDLQIAIKSYFEAEMSRNADAVWNLLAPSSVFRRFYSYEDYLELSRLNPIRVIDYELKFQPEISENEDKENLPSVEKIASVVVRVRIKGENGKESEHISVFVFLFENGRWYKG
ncbi:MAG: hypothetical protein V1897_04425 [Pseudomonadota bacterium]